jgi:pyruvate kinase
MLQADRTCYFTSGLVFRQRHGKARLRVGPLAPVRGERLLRPGGGTLPCTLQEVFVDLRIGERVRFDDGRVGVVIRGVSPRARGSRLRSDKGIHVPDSDLRSLALTAQDIEDLAFVTGHADMVITSFVCRESDIQILLQ